MPIAKPRFWDEMWAGLALFFSSYYVLGLNSHLLGQMGMPESGTLTGSLLVIIIFNLTSIIFTGTGLMIAPAIGISIFVVTFVQSAHSPSIYDWRDAMAASAMAGVALLVTTWFAPAWRPQIIKDMPEPVRKGATAAIGSLLVTEAFRTFNDIVTEEHHPKYAFAFWCVALGTTCILAFIWARNRFRPYAEATGKDWLMLLLRMEFLLVVGAITIAIHIFEPGYLGHFAPTPLQFLWTSADISALHSETPTMAMSFVLAAMIWFIVITDIPGTPNMILPEEVSEANDGRAVKRGYLNDAWAAFCAPFLGTSTTIYYVENQLLKDFNVYSRAVGYWMVGMFTLVLLALVFFGQKISIEQIIPHLAVVPVLLAIGMYVVAISFANGGSEEEKIEPAKEGAPASSPAIEPKTEKKVVWSAEEFLPAAIAVALTPRIGLEYSFPLTILSYWCGQQRGKGCGPSFQWVTGGAVIVLGVVLYVHRATLGAP